MPELRTELRRHCGRQSDREVFFINAQTGEKILCPVKVEAGVVGVHCVTFNGTGDTIVAGCYNGNIFFIDTATSQVREPPLRGHRYVPSLSNEYFLSRF